MEMKRDNLQADEAQLRKRSVGVIEVTDDKGRRKTVALDDLNDADRELAAKFGYKPVFKREFGYLSTFSFAVSISGLFATISTTFYYPLVAGDSASAVWSWFISGAGCMCIALSVSELVSAYPTCGGLYYTVSKLSPPNWIPSLSWITGWINLLGQVAGVASSEYGSAQLLLAAVSMASGSHLDEQTGYHVFNFQPTAHYTVGVMAALTIVCGLINSLPTYWMEKMTKTYVIFHVCVLVACSIALLVVAPDSVRHDAVHVFTHVEGRAGWTPLGWSFLFGFLSVSWTMTDYDATAHITEEINEPELKAPWAISMAMLFTYLAGFLFNIVLCFVMGDADELLSSAQPVALLYYNALGPAGGVFFTCCAVVILQFVCFTATQALGRTVFAFSRDKLLPLSNVWTIVNKTTGTPLYAVWVSILCCVLINLIALGSNAAIVGVFGVTAIALDWSYVIPIICKMAFGKFEPGPWHLGKFSWIVNLWAIIWTTFVTVIFILPTTLPTTAESMNYAVVFFVFILVMAMIFWYAFGKKYYSGPLTETEIQGDSIPRDSSSGEEEFKDTKTY